MLCVFVASRTCPHTSHKLIHHSNDYNIVITCNNNCIAYFFISQLIFIFTPMIAQCKWSRKGFLRTRWNISGTVMDMVNIHLFHDASNLVASEEYPSMYCKSRRRALVHTLERYIFAFVSFVWIEINLHFLFFFSICFYHFSAPTDSTRTPKMVWRRISCLAISIFVVIQKAWFGSVLQSIQLSIYK